MALRVMTWNLWWRFGDWRRREDAILAVLEAQEPDVVCLQETWAWREPLGDDTFATPEIQAAHLAQRLGWHVAVNEPLWFTERAFSNAILSRWPLRVVADETLPRDDHIPPHRRMLVAHAATPWGDWPFMTTHLDHRFDDSAARQTQVRLVLDCAKTHRGDAEVDLPLVLGADANAVPDADEIRILTGRSAGGPGGIVMTDVWEVAGEGPGHTWRRDNPHVANSTWPNRRVDYLMVTWPRPRPFGNPIATWLAGTEPVRVGGAEIWASDHAAVVADLTTPPEPTGT